MTTTPPRIAPVLILALAMLLLPYEVAPAADPAPETITPAAHGQTEPVPHAGDAADDPAIWVHPTDPAKSLILGTDKQGGLHVYDLDGKQRQLLNDGCRPNNVDVIYGFKFPATQADLAVASTRSERCLGVKVWRIDAETGRLTDATAGGVLKVFSGKTGYGICGYRSPKDGRCYFIVTSYEGPAEQHELIATPGGKVTSKLVRKIKINSITEGCVADDELSRLYIAEEGVGIWRFNAEPDGGEKGELVAKTGQNGLTGDVEGLTIYAAAGGKGYLIASSQGSSNYKIYNRDDNAFVATMDPKAGDIDDVCDTDGIAVTNRATSAKYPAGLFVVQDGDNKPANQNFKIYDWREIAGKTLLVDPEHPCRR